MTIIEKVFSLLALAVFCAIVAVKDGPSRVGPVLDAMLCGDQP